MQARRKFAVAGVTGTVGRHVVDVLEAEDHDVVGMSRSLGVDVVTGEGLAEAPGRRGVHNRRRHPALARPAGGHGVIHRRGPDPAGGRRAGRRAADGRGMAKLLVARRGTGYGRSAHSGLSGRSRVKVGTVRAPNVGLQAPSGQSAARPSGPSPFVVVG
jgi:uncharacterized protein YbjT (DUF2867 family)